MAYRIKGIYKEAQSLKLNRVSKTTSLGMLRGYLSNVFPSAENRTLRRGVKNELRRRRKIERQNRGRKTT